ncbi:2-hydroxymuconate tautomerase [Cytobacillus horneckiae]|uniref:2-hydroxymuconate tautomerase n=1 Tax=Cytobacillus horneckiae TaxID=549687 RepID=UPI0034CEA8E2
MPIVHVHLLSGRTAEQNRQIIREVSKATAKSADVPLENVRVLLHEVPKSNWGTGGILKDEVKSD